MVVALVTTTAVALFTACVVGALVEGELDCVEAEAEDDAASEELDAAPDAALFVALADAADFEAVAVVDVAREDQGMRMFDASPEYTPHAMAPAKIATSRTTRYGSNRLGNEVLPR